MENNTNQKPKPIYMVGHSHLDPAWQWHWQEGSAEVKATLRSALDRMNEFPDFKFVCSSAVFYQWIEDFSPSMFAELKQRVLEGRFVIVGGWHIQPDCNLASGEGYARQSLYAQRYFKETFGMTAKVGYNVDSFGHNLMFPQILKKSGMPYYLYQRPSHEENPELNDYLFNWFSPDGSSVLTYHLHPRSWLHHLLDPDVKIIDGHDEISIKDQVPSLYLYGVCNHGGGVTIESIKNIKAFEEANPNAEVIFSTLADFFEDVEASGKELPEYHNDLQHFASGCYSAVSSIKTGIRRSETALIAAESYSVLASALCQKPSKTAYFAEAWRNICFLHFHDVMSGTSIKSVYDEDCSYMYGMAQHTAAVQENSSLQTISWAIDTADDVEKGVPLMVFNPNGFDAEELVQVNTQCESMTDSEGNPVTFQLVHAENTSCSDKRKDVLFKAKVPALGYAVYYMKGATRWGIGPYQEFITVDGPVKASLWKNYQNVHTDGVEGFLDANADAAAAAEEHYSKYGGAVLENEYYRIEFEQYSGYIVSYKDKRTGKELISDRACVPVVIDEYYSDVWGIDHPYYTDICARFLDAKMSVVECGPLRATVKVVSRYNDSTLTQYFSLETGSERLQVRAIVDWHEKHKMLKLAWPFNMDEPKVYYEIPFGVIERPANKEEEPSHQWVAMKDSSNGMAIINNNTYSAHADGSTLYHTIIRSPLYNDGGGLRTAETEHNFSDQGRHDFRYELMPVKDSWAPVIRAARQLNKPMTNIIENWHKGYISDKVYQGIHISSDNIMLSACKHSEDGNGLVLRLYETDGKETDVTVSGGILPVPLKAKFTPYSVNTYYLGNGAEDWKEVLITEYDME